MSRKGAVNIFETVTNRIRISDDDIEVFLKFLSPCDMSYTIGWWTSHETRTSTTHLWKIWKYGAKKSARDIRPMKRPKQTTKFSIQNWWWILVT